MKIYDLKYTFAGLIRALTHIGSLTNKFQTSLPTIHFSLLMFHSFLGWVIFSGPTLCGILFTVFITSIFKTLAPWTTDGDGLKGFNLDE